MKEKLTQLLQEGKDRIDAVRSEAELQEVKALLLGKQGSLTGLLKELPKLDAALRPEMGKAVNQAKAQLTALLDQRREELKLKASEVSPDFDISVPGILPPSGGLYPITQMCYDLNDAFRSMGFEIFEESDITSELYGFDNLNFPPTTPPVRAWTPTGWRVTTRASAGISSACVPTSPAAPCGICRPTSPPTASCTPAGCTATRPPMPATSVPSSSMRPSSWTRTSPSPPAR